MHIAHSNIEKKENKHKRRVPLYKDMEAIIAASDQMIRENNERLIKLQEKEKPCANRAIQ